jgi:hypothetical protein
MQTATELGAEARKGALSAPSEGGDVEQIKMLRMRALPASLLLDAVRLTPIQQVQFFVPVVKCAGFVADTVDAQHLFTHGCRILIDKVSQLEDAALLGSLTRWMCTVIPLDHRPSLNISKIINNAHPVHIEDVPEGTLDSLGMTVDGAKYTQFWELQSSMQATDVLTSAEKWTACAAQVEVVLQAFEGPMQVRFALAHSCVLVCLGDPVPVSACPPQQCQALGSLGTHDESWSGPSEPLL